MQAGPSARSKVKLDLIKGVEGCLKAKQCLPQAKALKICLPPTIPSAHLRVVCVCTLCQGQSATEVAHMPQHQVPRPLLWTSTGVAEELVNKLC